MEQKEGIRSVHKRKAADRRKARFVIAMLVLTLAGPLLIGIALDLELSMICETAFYARRGRGRLAGRMFLTP